MNRLEHEYEDNVLRVKMRERRRRWIIGGAQIGAVAALGVWLAFELRVAWSLAGVAVYFGAHGMVRLRRWIVDRGVESSSTDRERMEDDGPDRARHTVTILGTVVACAGLRMAPLLALVGTLFLCALTMLGIAIAKLREDAIAEREERWLDSADTCEVRPRKWSK
jgi:uncharacterized membrane protein